MRKLVARTAGASTITILLALVVVSALQAGGSLPGEANTAPRARDLKRLLTESEIQILFRDFAPEYGENPGPDAIGCDILDGRGLSVRTVVAAEIGDRAYWLKYASGGVFATRVDFMTVPLFTGSPLTRQIQSFAFESDDTDVSTPFGIPVWALDLTTGPWALVVRNDLGDTAICRFDVVP